MSENHFWYGYLEAGSKSSPVLLDRRLNTGDPHTMYLFNLSRGEIIEYKRAIIEPKLRELNEGEQGISQELKSQFGKVRSGFVPRGGRAQPVNEGPAQPTASQTSDKDEVGLADDFDEIIEDEDDELDDEWEEDED